MSIRSKLSALREVVRALWRHPTEARRVLAQLDDRLRGERLLADWGMAPSRREPLRVSPQSIVPNRLREYFDSVTTGPGIWKWLHYFDLYDRHLGRFVDREVVIVEVGVYSGGSLPMWRSYFGPKSRVHGIDIEPACRVYAEDRIQIHLGDQADRDFWRRFREQVPVVDVLIDDGGHLPGQQMVTLEEMLPHLQPGGVYICEDVHGAGHPFSAFAAGLIDRLHAWQSLPDAAAFGSVPTAAQREIDSVHVYPFSVVVELRDRPVQVFDSARHGTQWQPFL